MLGFGGKLLAKKAIKKIFKLAFFIVLIYFAWQVALSSQGILDVGDSTDSKKGFETKVFSSLRAMPEVVLRYLHIVDKEVSYDEIPKEILTIYKDLERELDNKLIPAHKKTESWRLLKVKKIAMKYGIADIDLISIYNKVKKSYNKNLN